MTDLPADLSADRPTESGMGPEHMTPDEFREAGRAAIDWLADFLADHRDGGHARPIVPDVVPGDVYRSLPS